MNNEIKFLPPFKRMCMSIGTLPSSFYASMSYYESMVWLYEYLKNEVIPVVNNNSEVAEELQTAFTTLENYIEHYFENLDIQHEVDVKLDEMALDGTLADMIAEYIKMQGQLVYDTVASMKSAENIQNGSFLKTCGFYSYGDGGGAYYKARTITNEDVIDDMTLFALHDNTLVAQLIIDNNEICVDQLGAKGDGTTDDSDIINKALSISASTVNFGYNKTYMVRGYEVGQAEGDEEGLVATTGLVIPSNRIVNLNESTVKVIPNARQNYNIFTIAGVHDIVLKNGSIIGDKATHTGATGEWGYGVAIKYASNITLENLICKECWGDGINLNNNGSTATISQNIYITNCICESNRRQGMSVENGENIYVTNSSFNKTGDNNIKTNPASGVDVEPGDTGNVVNNIIFNYCNFNENYNDGIVVDGGIIKTVKIMNSRFLDNHQTTSQSSLAFIESGDVLFENNTVRNDVDDISVKIQVRPKTGIRFVNNYFKNGMLLLYSEYLDKDYITFEGNTFENVRNSQYNGIIETVDVSTTNTNNTLIVRNNNFLGTPTLNIAGWIISKYSSKFNKLICTNNHFKYGKRGISTSSSNIISNNNFVALYEFPILINTGYTYQVSHIDSNVFEECCYNAQNAGVIQNSNNNNLILQDNTIYKNCLSVDDQQTRTYTPSRFLQNLSPTGITLDDNNNIFDNAIS